MNTNGLRKMSVTNGVCGVIHTAAADETRTLCGRNASRMLTLTGSGWDVVGWEATSKGACQRCSAKLAKIAATPAAVAPIALDTTPAGMRGARGGRNYFVTAPSAIAYELRHVMQISRDWRQGMTEFATIGQHGSGYWTVTQGHTASGAPMELTDEPMTLTCVTRFADSRQAQAAVRANGYR